jgi:DNA-binding transcriptional LysR family regulator
MKLDIRHLRVVVAVADAGSLSEAARVLGVSQPTVSTQLRRIEDSLGGALFERSAHGSAPTELGRTVLRRARNALALIDRLQGADTGPPVPATVRVRTFILPFEILLPLLRPLVPDVRWEVASGPGQEGLAAVSDGSAELYYGLQLDGDPPIPADVVIDVVLRERAWVLLSADHPLAAAPVIELGSLATSAWACRPEPGLQRALRQDCRRAGFEPDLQFSVVDPVALMSVVESGAAVALASPVADRSDSVVIRPCANTAERAWVLAHRADRVPGVLARTVRDLMRWGYAFRARENPELAAVLPADLLATPFPEAT